MRNIKQKDKEEKEEERSHNRYWWPRCNYEAKTFIFL